MRVPDVFDREDDEEQGEPRQQLKCKRCGSTDVRWRMQNGRWTLFSSKPGVLHTCQKLSAKDDFSR